MRAAGFRMGPFELMDFIGIDINFAVTQSVYSAFFGEPRYRPHPIQQRMVEANTLGRKTGQGFYYYAGGKQGEPALTQTISLEHKRTVPFIPEHLTQVFLSRGGIVLPEDQPELGEIVVRLLVMLMNEAAYAVGEGVASVRDIDIAMKLGTNYPKGPLKWADEIGLDTVHSVLKSLLASLADQRYRPAPSSGKCSARAPRATPSAKASTPPAKKAWSSRTGRRPTDPPAQYCRLPPVICSPPCYN